jgi:hypothetical protein
VKESGIIIDLHQSGIEKKKRKEGGRKGKKHNSFCSKPEGGTKETSIKE